VKRKSSPSNPPILGKRADYIVADDITGAATIRPRYELTSDWYTAVAQAVARVPRDNPMRRVLANDDAVMAQWLAYSQLDPATGNRVGPEEHWTPESVSGYRSWHVDMRYTGRQPAQPMLKGYREVWESLVLVARCSEPTFTSTWVEPVEPTFTELIEEVPANAARKIETRQVRYTDPQVPHWDPKGNHICGIHAWKRPASAYGYGHGMPVFGRVELTGKIIEHELGYRAEVATITDAIIMWDSYTYTGYSLAQLHGGLTAHYGPVFSVMHLSEARHLTADQLHEAIDRRFDYGTDRKAEEDHQK